MYIVKLYEPNTKIPTYEEIFSICVILINKTFTYIVRYICIGTTCLGIGRYTYLISLEYMADYSFKSAINKNHDLLSHEHHFNAKFQIFARDLTLRSEMLVVMFTEISPVAKRNFHLIFGGPSAIVNVVALCFQAQQILPHSVFHYRFASGMQSLQRVVCVVRALLCTWVKPRG